MFVSEITAAAFSPSLEAITGHLADKKRFKVSLNNREGLLALALLTGFSKVSNKLIAQERALREANFPRTLQAEFRAEIRKYPMDLWAVMAREAIGSEVTYETRIFQPDGEPVVIRNEYGELEAETSADADPIEWIALIPKIEADLETVEQYR